jgi:hypothetical protein
MPVGKPSKTHRPIDPPRRVEILQGSGGSNAYFKRGQFAYVLAANTAGGMWLVNRESASDSKPGEIAYLVSKTKGMRGGALWFSADALRFTGSQK